MTNEPAIDAWYQSAPVDVEKMKQALDPDVVFRVCPGWPSGGTYRGHDEVFGAFFPAASRSWEKISPEVDAVFRDGDTRIVRGRYVGVAAGSGIPFSVDFVHIWQIREGRLVALDQLADTAVLVAAIEGRNP